MRIGLIGERKDDYPLQGAEPSDIQSELLTIGEEDELLSGLQDAGHHVMILRNAEQLLRSLPRVRKSCDLIFNQSTGYRGNERMVMVPAILTAANLPYVGSTPYVHGLLRNKHHAKLVVAAAGVATPPAVLVDGRADVDLCSLTFPAIVKPVAESSSIGIDASSIVGGPEEALVRAKRLVCDYRQPALVETFVRGLEIEVPIVVDPEPRALGLVTMTLDGAPVSGDAFLVSDAVYDDGYGFSSPPPTLESAPVKAAAVRAARALGLRDYGRVDLRVSADGTPWFMEADTVPHIQRHSSFFFLAEQRGLAYHQMLEELIQIASRRLLRER